VDPRYDPENLPALPDQRSALDGAQSVAMNHTVKGSANINLTYSGPPARVNTSTKGDLFQKVQMARNFQMPESSTGGSIEA
jgi:hypothetical protein